MDKINKLLLEALKASLYNQKVDWNFEIQPQEWIHLFRQADIHHILPMIYDAVYNCPSAKKSDASFFVPFKKKTVQQVMIQTMKTGEFFQLYQYLQKAGIKPVMVKGIICRELYPNPDYRSSGDEDMLIRPEIFDLCHSKLLEYGMVAADPDQDIQKVYEVPYGKQGSPIYIELHKYLFPPDSEAYGEFNRFFDNAHEQAIEMLVQGIPVSTMEYTDHLFYLICHSFKHFLHSGFGIRQVCDIILFANTYGDRIDWQRIMKNCRAIQAELFTAALFRIGSQYLVFDPDKSRYPEEWRTLAVDETLMLKDLLDSGVYGASSMSRKHSSNITLNAVSAQKQGRKEGSGVLKTVFPSVQQLKNRYPYLTERPYLLPVAWADRILKYRKELQQLDGQNQASESIKIGSQRTELMKKYGIIK